MSQFDITNRLRLLTYNRMCSFDKPRVVLMVSYDDTPLTDVVLHLFKSFYPAMQKYTTESIPKNGVKLLADKIALMWYRTADLIHNWRSKASMVIFVISATESPLGLSVLRTMINECRAFGVPFAVSVAYNQLIEKLPDELQLDVPILPFNYSGTDNSVFSTLISFEHVIRDLINIQAKKTETGSAV